MNKIKLIVGVFFCFSVLLSCNTNNGDELFTINYSLYEGNYYGTQTDEINQSLNNSYYKRKTDVVLAVKGYETTKTLSCMGESFAIEEPNQNSFYKSAGYSFMTRLHYYSDFNSMPFSKDQTGNMG